MNKNNKTLHLFILIIITLVSCSKDDEFVENTLYPYNDWFSNSKVKIIRYAKGIKSHQSAAVFGDYAFFVTDKHTHFYMYNLKTKSYIYDLAYKTGGGKDFLGSTLYHSNQSTFGVEFYEVGDCFPLLYVSQHAKEDKRYFVEAYRILPIWNDSIAEFSSFSVQLVHTIYFPPMTEENSLGNVNMVIDAENRQIYTYSRNNNSSQNNSGVCKISQFDIPDIHQKKVYLEDSDIKSSFFIDSQAANMQGGCIKDGILYIGRGYYSVGYIYLYAINLELEAEVARIDILSKLHKWEPEGCFFYNGTVMLSATDGIWQFKK